MLSPRVRDRTRTATRRTTGPCETCVGHWNGSGTPTSARASRAAASKVISRMPSMTRASFWSRHTVSVMTLDWINRRLPRTTRFSYTSSRPVALKCHTNSVVAHTESFARTLRLPSKIAADVSLAAFLHDAGKADARFQTMLAGGDWWNRPDGPPIAKSGRVSPAGAWVRSGLPSGWRHEALSVRMARTHPRFAQAQDPELVLWLVGTHHGLGRPFFGFADPREDEAGSEPFSCLGVETLAPRNRPRAAVTGI